MLRRSFAERPASFDGGYLENLRAAIWLGTIMIRRGVVCIVHGTLPFLHERTGSSTVICLHDRMLATRRSARSNAVESNDLSQEPSEEPRWLANEANEGNRVDGPTLKWPGPEIVVWF
jgi:hypothetical protein